MIKKYESFVEGITKEVERILKENERSQGIHITIDMSMEEMPTINFEVSNRFPKIEEA
jgi:hypothetical protein